MLHNNRIRPGLIAVLILAFEILHPTPGLAGDFVPAEGTTIFRADVFINSDGTLVNPTTATPRNTSLYTSVGAPIEFVSWFKWRAANASAEAIKFGDPKHAHTEVRIRLNSLIPGGMYSIYYETFQPDSHNPYCPNAERLLPLTIFTSSPGALGQASFRADKSGRAIYVSRVDRDLLGAQQVVYDVIYHYDGQFYDPLPNRGESQSQGSACRSSFGVDAGRQLIIFQKG